MNLPRGDDKARAVRTMFDTIAPRYDLVNRIMCFRLDVRWRRRTIDELRLSTGSTVLDLACGTGDFCRELAARGFRAIGADFSWGMLHAAKTSVPLIQADALRLPVAAEAVDGVTCGFALRNFVALPPFFAELARVVRRGGRIALLEVSAPDNRLLRAGHGVYFGRVVPLIGRVFSDADAYRYLPQSVAYLPDAPELLAMLRDAGFDAVERRQLSTGITQLITGTRR